ncbi:MAG: hypothetical protein ABSF50_02390 [Burkholderiaceae bacterium]
MRGSCETYFAADHPTAAGHFPGNPVIPGAVLLDEVVKILNAHGLAFGTGFSLQSAKFLHPVRPGQRVEIRWHTDAQSQIRFECHREGQTVLAGSLRANPS